jgi:hypothetical protein
LHLKILRQAVLSCASAEGQVNIPSIATSCCRLSSILPSIALVLCALLSPIGVPKAPNARVYPNSLARKLALTSDAPGVGAFTSATPGGAFIDPDRSDLIEENEDESFYSFSYLVPPAFSASDGPPEVLSGPLPGNSLSRIVAAPLRC